MIHYTSMKNQKTIFITSFYGLIGRNLLATNILSTLFQNVPDSRVVIILPEEKQKLYQDLFGSERVIVQGVPNILETKLDLFFAKLFYFLSPTESSRISRDAVRQQSAVKAIIAWVLGQLGKSKIIRQAVRVIAYLTASKNRYKKYFDQYRPDLIFATDIFRHQDVDLLRESRSRGIRTLGMVRSWDNISTKGLNHFIPDQVIVQAEKMKEDIIKYGDVNLEKIHIVGVPHYDRYVTDKRIPREEFFKSMNLDPNKKTVVISPPLRHYTTDPIPEVIFNALAPNQDIQFIVRLTLVGKSNIGNLKPIPGKLFIDAPESADDFDQADITAGDRHLADILFHADAIISHLSTLVIDGIVFDRPAFFAGFNTKTMPYHQSVRWFFDMDCARDLLATGAVKLAENVEELVRDVLIQLANPNLGKNERGLVISRYCYKLDGKSGERLGKVIAETILSIASTLR